MATVEYFKAQAQTRRYRANQKVWIRLRCANHAYVRYRFRGSGRWVNGIQDLHRPCVGEIKQMEVADTFAAFVQHT